MERSADEAGILWQTLKTMARESLASGEYASHAVMGNQTPLRRAQFSVMLDAFTRAWQPRNAIELSLVETLVQAHISYNYWLASVAAAAEHSGYAAESIDSNAKRHEQWNPPRLTSQGNDRQCDGDGGPIQSLISAHASPDARPEALRRAGNDQ